MRRMNDPLSRYVSRGALGSREGPDWRTQLLPVRQCHVPSPSHIAAKLPQFPNSAFRSCSDGQRQLLHPRRVEPPRKVWLFLLPLLPQKPGCRSARTLSLARPAPAHKGRQTYLSFIRLNAQKRFRPCCGRRDRYSEGPRRRRAADVPQRSSSSIAASRVGTCSLRRIADT